MNNEEIQKILEQTTRSLIEKMGFKGTVYSATDASVISENPSSDLISIEIQLQEDSNYLIGKRGTNLSALQHLLRIMIKKKIDQKINFSIDINNYRAGHSESIIRLAKEMAKKALDEKKAVVLDPMNAFERRLVHMEIDKMDGLVTESDGEGEERKVIIKPVSL